MTEVASTGELTYDIFGFDTDIREVLVDLAERVARAGKWFTFCTKADDRQIDLASVKTNSGETLGRIMASKFPETIYRSAVYKYLINNYLCYMEYPALKKDYSDEGSFKDTFEKVLITSNLHVIAEWLDWDVDAVWAKYSAKLYDSLDDNGMPLHSCVKLTTSKEGIRKVVCPRKDMDLGVKGCRVVPVFALKAGVDVLYEEAAEGCIKIDFLKDNKELREISTTLNTDKIQEIYGNDSRITDALLELYDGVFTENPKLSRGFIRMFEIGESRFKDLVKSINYARIVSWSKIEYPDLAFVNVDLDSVYKIFTTSLLKTSEKVEEVSTLLQIYGVCLEKDIKNNASNMNSLVGYVGSLLITLGGSFTKQLALMMLSNPDLFEGWTGDRYEVKEESNGNIGLV